MKNYRLVLIQGVLLSLMCSRSFSAQINSIEFKKQDAETLVEISGSALTGYTKEEKTSPPELVLTFPNATLADSAKQKFDASSLSSSVIQVSSYSIAGGKARVVVDFASAPVYTIQDSDQKITLHLTDSKTTADTNSAPSDSSAPGAVPVASSTEAADAAQAAKKAAQAADSDAISTVMSSEKSQEFTGSPITLKLKDADVHEVLRLISETSGFNMVVHPSVNGKITVSLDHVPWDQALDVVLTTLKLGAERNGSVLRIMPKDMLLKEKQDEIDQKKLIAVATPRITRVFPISYSDMGQLSALLLTFANSQNNTPGSSGIPTTILVDQNTQSLVVRDTPDNVERIKKMIQLLDVQTPQVLIEAKTVEASESFATDLEGQFGIQLPGGSMGINSAPPPSSTSGLGGSATSGSSAASSSSSTRSNSVIMGIAGSLGVNAQLTYAETVSKAKVVSSPKTVVISGKSASINQVTSYAYTITNQGSAGVAATSQTVTATANTKLDVTPRVTNDGSVFMKLALSRDVLNLQNLNAPVAEPRTLNTEVIVESGSTLVIGGVLNLDENKSEQGIPFLRQLPIIGWLFGSDVYEKDKTELMFFITPRILNQKKTNLGMNPDEAPKT